MKHLCCPHCSNKEITKNGRFRGKQRWICKECQKTFTTDSLRRLPPTTIPFEFIAWVLFQREADSKFSTKKINAYLNFLRLKKEKVSRSTIHLWEKKYSDIYKQRMSKREIINFLKKTIEQVYIPQVPIYEKIEVKETIPADNEKLSWIDAVKILRDAFGKERLIKIIRENNEFFEKMRKGIKKPEIETYSVEAIVSIIKRKKYYSF